MRSFILCDFILLNVRGKLESAAAAADAGPKVEFTLKMSDFRHTDKYRDKQLFVTKSEVWSLSVTSTACHSCKVSKSVNTVVTLLSRCCQGVVTVLGSGPFLVM